MGRFDEAIDGAAETDLRALFFLDIARTLRNHIREQRFFNDRDFFRIRALTRELTWVYEQLDDETRTRRELDSLNTELTERVSGLSSTIVQMAMERDVQLKNARRCPIYVLVLALVDRLY